MWAFPCKEEEEKDIFLKLLKNCCIGVAFRQFSSDMREELWERLELLHCSEEEKQNTIVATKIHPGTPLCVSMFLGVNASLAMNMLTTHCLKRYILVP